jgi:hypothetical protein
MTLSEDLYAMAVFLTNHTIRRRKSIWSCRTTVEASGLRDARSSLPRSFNQLLTLCHQWHLHRNYYGGSVRNAIETAKHKTQTCTTIPCIKQVEKDRACGCQERTSTYVPDILCSLQTPRQHKLTRTVFQSKAITKRTEDQDQSLAEEERQ